MDVMKKALFLALAAGGMLLMVLLVLGFLFLALPLVAVLGAVAVWRVRQLQRRQPVVIDHVVKNYDMKRFTS